MKKYMNIVIAILVVLFGISLLGNNLELWDIQFLFDGWWTLFIIIPAILSIINSRASIGNIIVLVIGITFLVESLDIINKDISSIVFPILTIVFGIGILYKLICNRNNMPMINSDNAINYHAYFGGQEVNVSRLDECYNVDTLFGGIDIDFSDVNIDRDIYINIFVAFGGIDIILPNNVCIVSNGVPIFGGFESKKTRDSCSNVVYINYTVLFGGIEVK